MALTPAQAAKYLNISYKGIILAIMLNKLKASKEQNRWHIELQDLLSYQNNRYNRSYSTFKGQPLFDRSIGEYSVKECAQKLGVPSQHVYHALRKKRINAYRKGLKGSTWVINEQEIERYRSSFMILNKRKRETKFKVV